MLNFNFPEKGLGLACPTHFFIFEKNVSHVMFYELTKFHCLIAFTSQNIGQYVYYNCFLLCRHRI